jgi:catalase
MRVDGNYGGAASYEPNSRNEWLEQPEFAPPPLAIDGAAAHWNHRVDSDYFSQPGILFRKFTPDHKLRLYYNTARALGDASAEVKDRHIGLCAQADSEYGAGVAEAVAWLARGDTAPA